MTADDIWKLPNCALRDSLLGDLSRRWRCIGCREVVKLNVPAVIGNYCCPGCRVRALAPVVLGAGGSMKRRIAKKILGIKKEMRAMFCIRGGARKSWRLDAYTWPRIHEAHRLILRAERRHGFPSKWS